MKAKVKVNHRDMKGNTYDIVEVSPFGRIFTLKYTERLTRNDILVDFSWREIEILNEGKDVEVYRNQNYRDGIWLGYCPINKGYILEYEMPNGRRFKNLVKNPCNTKEYTTKIK